MHATLPNNVPMSLRASADDALKVDINAWWRPYSQLSSPIIHQQSVITFYFESASQNVQFLYSSVHLNTTPCAVGNKRWRTRPRYNTWRIATVVMATNSSFNASFILTAGSTNIKLTLSANDWTSLAFCDVFVVDFRQVHTINHFIYHKQLNNKGPFMLSFIFVWFIFIQCYAVHNQVNVDVKL